MKKVKITVVKAAFYADLAEQFAGPGLGPCTYNVPGQVFYTNGWQKPEGLCDNAWKSMMEYAMTLAHGGRNFYRGWMRDDKTAMVSCNDGFRPVSYYLEALDEEAEVFMEPVAELDQ